MGLYIIGPLNINSIIPAKKEITEGMEKISSLNVSLTLDKVFVLSRVDYFEGGLR